MKYKIMLLCKKTPFCEYAIKILESYFPKDEILVVRGTAGEPIDENLYLQEPEYIISFLSPWIVPKKLLVLAQKAAINFHPGSPRYPGYGCYCFALYERTEQYGVTCHYMEEKVDAGDVIMTSYFDVSPRETVETLKLKSMNHLLFIFEKIINGIYTSDFLPKSDEKWLCSQYTKKQLYDLYKINPITMDAEEIDNRIRSTTYGPYGTYISIGDKRFSYDSANRNPIV